jgi:hypothetical protein
MDVNYLLHRQQVSLIRAAVADSPESRAAHEGLARGYTNQVHAYRLANSRAHAGMGAI